MLIYRCDRLRDELTHFYFPSATAPRVALAVAGNVQYYVMKMHAWLHLSMLLSIVCCHASSSAAVEYAAVCPPTPPFFFSPGVCAPCAVG